MVERFVGKVSLQQHLLTVDDVETFQPCVRKNATPREVINETLHWVLCHGIDARGRLTFEIDNAVGIGIFKVEHDIGMQTLQRRCRDIGLVEADVVQDITAVGGVGASQLYVEVGDVVAAEATAWEGAGDGCGCLFVSTLV